MSTAPAILARLTAMGARIDCRGDRLVVRAGRRPLPVGLIEEARAAKAELSKALSAIEDAQTRNDEHLRETVVDKPRISAAPAEDAQMSTFDEHLRDQERAHGAEDAHLVEPMSIFDESLDFRGFPSRPPSKMLIPPSLSTLDDDEHLQAPTSPAAVSDETGESRAVSVRRGRVPRAWLEGLARLDPVRPPGDVPVKRWQTFIVDIGRFFDGGWGEKAAALGWEALDLFGCDRDRPFARIDHAGLLWVLNGDRLVALENTIRGLLRQEGIGLTDKRSAFEAAVREAIGDDRLLEAALHPLLETRNAVLQHRATLDRQILRIVRADPVCRLLMTAPGVGALVSLTFKVAVDDPRRFSRSRDVGAHFGLTREYSSGEVSYRGRISKMGDREVRRLLYVAASRMLRRDAALWCPLKVWAVRIAQRVGIRRARVALARKLAVVLHAMWSDGQVFQWRRSEASPAA